MTSNELEHYGVIGMRWGVRKDTEKAYSKAGAKLAKLDRKASESSLKGSISEQKASKKQAKATSAILFQKRKAKTAAKATRKALKNYQKAQNYQVKAYNWNEQMKKAFSNTKVSNLNPEYVALGKKYSSTSLDKLMSNNVSMQSLMSMDEYYRRRAQ